jgi:aldose 1-epimerase
MLSLSNGPLKAVLAPAAGGSIARLDYADGAGGFEIFRGHDAPSASLESGCFPLVPYVNRIRGGSFMFREREVRIALNAAGDPSPLHGHGWQAPWEVVRSDENEAALLYRHAAGEWPWAYDAQQTFAIAPDRLTMTLSCTNRDEGDMPCGLGFHPYFPCNDATRLSTAVEHVWTVDADILPVERIQADGIYDVSDGPVCGRGLDNGYDGWSGAARFHYPDRPYDVEMSSPDGAFFQLYAPKSGGMFVAEPVTHANAALNAPEADWAALGIRVLAPGETMELTMTIAVMPR